MAEHPEHDIVIVGGGPVGCAAALGLAPARRSVLLLDATPPLRSDDARTLALSYGSRLILERLGVWDHVTPRTDICTIHISHRGGFGSTVLTAADAQTPALGYVARYASVQRALQKRLFGMPELTVQTGARVVAVVQQADRVLITYDDARGQHLVSAALAVIADGGALAQQLVPGETRDYEQCALVCNVTTSSPHRNRAFERFTENGPVALLPHEDGYAVVWTVAPDSSRDLSTTEPAAFLARLQETFGTRVGKFSSVHDRAVFPLALRVARIFEHGRMVLIGNAALALHPVAGQGLNLGLRDAWELASHVCSSASDGGVDSMLRLFLRQRQRDRRTSVFLTDAMVRTFSNRNLALQWLRGCGLTFLDCVPPVKRKFMQQMIFGTLW